MKKILLLLVLLPVFFACDGGSINYKNPNLPNYPVNLTINMNLNPNLQFPGNHYVSYSQGVAGIVVFNTGSGFSAFDLACPNQAYGTACSTAMTVNGIELKCNCNTSEAPYSMFTAQSPGLPYGLKPYRVEVVGGNLVVLNN